MFRLTACAFIGLLAIHVASSMAIDETLLESIGQKVQSGDRLKMNETACMELADTLNQVDQLAQFAYKNVKQLTSKWVSIIEEFPNCISWNPAKTVTCMEGAVADAKKEAKTTQTMIGIIKDSLNESFKTLKEQLQECLNG